MVVTPRWRACRPILESPARTRPAGRLIRGHYPSQVSSEIEAGPHHGSTGEVMMSDAPGRKLTQMLNLAGQGDPRASAELLPLLYRELRKLAGALMARIPPGNTLQPTALVHEAYLRLVGPVDSEWNSRGHFFSAAAQAMRQIMVDQARRKAARKHGGGLRRVDLDGAGEADLRIESPVEDLLALDEALRRLEHDAPRKAEVVKLRYFAGLSSEETAAALGVSLPTVERDWRFARAVLLADLGEDDAAS